MGHDHIKLGGKQIDLTALDTQLSCDGNQVNFMQLMSHMSGEDQLTLVRNLVKENQKEEITKNWMHEAKPGEGHARLYLDEVTLPNQHSSTGDPRPFTEKIFTLESTYANGNGSKEHLLFRQIENLRNPTKPTFESVLFPQIPELFKVMGSDNAPSTRRPKPLSHGGQLR